MTEPEARPTRKSAVAAPLDQAEDELEWYRKASARARIGDTVSLTLMIVLG